MSRRISSCRSVSSSTLSPVVCFMVYQRYCELYCSTVHVALYTVYAKDCPFGYGCLLRFGRAARQPCAARQAARGGRPPGGTRRSGGGEGRGASPRRALGDADGDGAA